MAARMVTRRLRGVKEDRMRRLDRFIWRLLALIFGNRRMLL